VLPRKLNAVKAPSSGEKNNVWPSPMKSPESLWRTNDVTCAWAAVVNNKKKVIQRMLHFLVSVSFQSFNSVLLLVVARMELRGPDGVRLHWIIAF